MCFFSRISNKSEGTKSLNKINVLVGKDEEFCKMSVYLQPFLSPKNNEMPMQNFNTRLCGEDVSLSTSISVYSAILEFNVLDNKP